MGRQSRPLMAQKFFSVNFLLEISFMLIFVLYMFLTGNCLNFSKKKKKKMSAPYNLPFLKYNRKFPFLCFFFFFLTWLPFFFYFHINFGLLPSICHKFQLSSAKKKHDRNLYKKLLCRELTGRRARLLTTQKFFFRQFSLGTFFGVDFCFIYVSNGKLSELKKKKKRKKVSTIQLPIFEI